MTLKYLWENQKVNMEYDTYGVSPHTKQEIRDVRFEYEVRIKIQDIVQYLIPYNLQQGNLNTTQINEVKLANFYMTKALSYIKENTECDFNELIMDEDFVEYMKERYEEDAYEEWKNSNESY